MRVVGFCHVALVQGYRHFPCSPDNSSGCRPESLAQTPISGQKTQANAPVQIFKSGGSNTPELPPPDAQLSFIIQVAFGMGR